MKVYKLLLLLDHEGEEITRLIELPAHASLETLHLTILSAYNFDDSQLASFYLSDKNWEKGEEITLVDMSCDETSAQTMDQCTIESTLKKDDRIIYVYDFVLMWTFKIFVHQITETDRSEEEYPLLLEEKGKAPEQYQDMDKYTAELTEKDKELLAKAMLGEDEDEDEGDDDYSDEFENYDESNWY